MQTDCRSSAFLALKLEGFYQNSRILGNYIRSLTHINMLR